MAGEGEAEIVPGLLFIDEVSINFKFQTQNRSRRQHVLLGFALCFG